MDKKTLILLKAEQDKLVEITEELNVKKAAFNEENKDLIEYIQTIKHEITKLKDEITIDAKTDYLATQETKLMGGIGIRIKKVIDYNETEAFEWCKVNSPISLKLDIKSFENLIKANTDKDFKHCKIPCVKLDTDIVVTFPTKGIQFEDDE